MTSNQPLRDGDRPPSGDGLFARKGLIRRALRYGGMLVILSAAVLVAGFLIFADSVSNMRPPETVKADAIVVLTGGYQRIEQAIDLLKRGYGERLLISGVNPATTAGQIRKATRTSPDLFDCCVDIGYAAIDTIGNANETAIWIRDKGYRSILVVTSNYHLSRSLMELRRSDPDTEFIGYPVVNADLKTRAWYSEPDAMRTMLAEYGKTVIAYVRGVTGWSRDQGLRPDGEITESGRTS
ncbi:MAG: YdcF family protein [Allorhizobium sp.]|uniref:YdcF family protein n=1 Tax=Rhizobium rosettiformans TaxID=1368430 RepID=A0ABX7EQW0_9HYPH|nr:YdcF family protein [Rhizobium rosettiformans]QRF50727.1 YdcF family protein [Rhizobium rosettiformans]